jgi:hypothetical protein
MTINYNLLRTALPILLSLIVHMGCHKKNEPSGTSPSFSAIPLSKSIRPGLIDEASGIADSKANPGYLWVEQDSGNPNDIALLSQGGQILKKINIRSAINRDWEDIALGNGPDPGINYLYIADIGDNSKVNPQCSIYRFQEPSASIDTVSVYDELKFNYPDGSHDAEAILIDNNSKDIYIITKTDVTSRIYKFSYPQSTSSVSTVILIGSLPFSGVTSAASSASGDELLIKTYTSLSYWKRNMNETIGDALERAPISLNYQVEPQGEAVCFKNDNSGFYTLSERPSLISAVSLNFYERKL